MTVPRLAGGALLVAGGLASALAVPVLMAPSHSAELPARASAAFPAFPGAALPAREPAAPEIAHLTDATLTSGNGATTVGGFVNIPGTVWSVLGKLTFTDDSWLPTVTVGAGVGTGSSFGVTYNDPLAEPGFGVTAIAAGGSGSLQGTANLYSGTLSGTVMAGYSVPVTPVQLSDVMPGNMAPGPGGGSNELTESLPYLADPPGIVPDQFVPEGIPPVTQNGASAGATISYSYLSGNSTFSPTAQVSSVTAPISTSGTFIGGFAAIDTKGAVNAVYNWWNGTSGASSTAPGTAQSGGGGLADVLGINDIGPGTAQDDTPQAAPAAPAAPAAAGNMTSVDPTGPTDTNGNPAAGGTSYTVAGGDGTYGSTQA